VIILNDTRSLKIRAAPKKKALGRAGSPNPIGLPVLPKTFLLGNAG